ncbi:hypothetical protein B738_17644 [Photorhabdus temperata subsp. temperata M1021]|nr:hypothetical protein B738_17644 [Photorhabdus temperata subsp. temperata M1021]
MIQNKHEKNQEYEQALKNIKCTIPFIFQVAALLVAFTYPSHIVIYAPGEAFTCRRLAT